MKSIKTDMQPIKTDMQLVESNQNWHATGWNQSELTCNWVQNQYWNLFIANVNQPKKVYVTQICSFQKHGLKCLVGCGECRGESCGSYMDIIEEDYDQDMFERNQFNLFN